jgi:hypothetical protein
VIGALWRDDKKSAAGRLFRSWIVSVKESAAFRAIIDTLVRFLFNW